MKGFPASGVVVGVVDPPPLVVVGLIVVVGFTVLAGVDEGLAAPGLQICPLDVGIRHAEGNALQALRIVWV